MLKRKPTVVVQTWGSSGQKGGDFANSGSYADDHNFGYLSEEKQKQTQEKTCTQTRSEVQRYT